MGNGAGYGLGTSSGVIESNSCNNANGNRPWGNNSVGGDFYGDSNGYIESNSCNGSRGPLVCVDNGPGGGGSAERVHFTNSSRIAANSCNNGTSFTCSHMVMATPETPRDSLELTIVTMAINHVLLTVWTDTEQLISVLAMLDQTYVR